MAYTTTILQDAVVTAYDNLTKFENRIPDLDSIAAFSKYTSELVPQATIDNLKVSARRPVKIPVFKKYNPTVRTVRRITAAPADVDTDFLPVTWETVGGEVGLVESVSVDNYLGSVQSLAHQIQGLIANVVNTLDVKANTKLEASKFATPGATSLSGVAVTAGAYVMAQTNFYQYAPTLMRKLKMKGPYQVFSNIEAMAELDRISTYGANNSQNLQTLTRNYEFNYSTNLAADASMKQTSFLVPAGSLGFLQWVEKDARDRRSNGTYSYDIMPITLNLPSGGSITLNFGVMEQAGPADKSATWTGLERAWTQSWGLYCDVAFISQYSSVSGETPIVKFNCN